MSWYDGFSTFYDPAVERIYRPYRERIVAALDLQPGDAVVDLACGTGQNFPELVRAVGAEGKVVGVDASSGMLSRARRRIAKAGWSNVRVLEADARTLRSDDLGEGPLAAVLCTLGFSAIPDWQRALANAFSLLPRGGRFVIFDVFARRWVPQTSVVSLVARADLKRESWRALKALSATFEMKDLPGSPHVHGGNLFLARGVRGDEWDTGEVSRALEAARAATRDKAPSEA